VVIENPGGRITASASIPGAIASCCSRHGPRICGQRRPVKRRGRVSAGGRHGTGQRRIRALPGALVSRSHRALPRLGAQRHRDLRRQSHDVTVRHSVAFANVNGIEFENSQRVQGVANETYDNVVGILVVVLPGLDVKTTSDVLVARNSVHDNNHPNFAPPGDLASFVPSGSGILIVGADRATVEGNTVSGNQFTGSRWAARYCWARWPACRRRHSQTSSPTGPRGDPRQPGHGQRHGVADPIPPAVDLLWTGRARELLGPQPLW